MVFRVVCAWCGLQVGIKNCDIQGPVKEAVTHTICSDCRDKVLAAMETGRCNAGIEVSTDSEHNV